MLKDKFDRLKEVIMNNNNFIVITHVNPDADAIGSQLAISKILKKYNKNHLLLNHSETPYYLKIFDSDNKIQKFDEEIHKDYFNTAEVIIIVDLNRVDRTVSMQSLISNFRGEIIYIDHHENPDDLHTLLIWDINYTSTGSLIYDFITHSKIIELDTELAELIYAAIMTDTGSFRFERTTEKTHLEAAHLIQCGVNPKSVYEKIYDNNRISKIKLLGLTLSDIRFYAENKIAWMVVTRKMLTETGAEESEVDGFVNYCLSIAGVKIGILFFELTNGIKISLRSTDNISVNKLASEFGGGGHYYASGIRLYNCELNDYINRILERAEQYLHLNN